MIEGVLTGISNYEWKSSAVNGMKWYSDIDFGMM